MHGADNDDNWVFGPDPELDNVYQNMPQVSLHGMDEGLTSKLNIGCLRAAIVELMATPGKIKWSKAAACRRIDRQVRAAIEAFYLHYYFNYAALKIKFVRNHTH